VRQPLRVLLDSRLDVTDDKKILAGGNTMIVTATGDEARAETLRQRGIEVVRVATEAAKGKVDLVAMVEALGTRKLNTVLIETGAKFNGSLLAAGVVDEIVAYVAPSLLGDDARGLFAVPALQRLDDRIRLSFTDVRQIGSDLRITARILSH
jgi:diaminohydroxyphosphoribosylaminopyrimidine deaminase / 5-amino-6-(5-phosphoribosylamino)uracil reductase